MYRFFKFMDNRYIYLVDVDMDKYQAIYREVVVHGFGTIINKYETMGLDRFMEITEKVDF